MLRQFVTNFFGSFLNFRSVLIVIGKTEIQYTFFPM